MATSHLNCLLTLAFVTVAIFFPLQNVPGQEKPISPIAAEHDLLNQDVGTWNVEIKIWPGPNAEPIISTGFETSKLLPGGLWLETRFEGTMAGAPCVGVGTWGYDPVEKKYTGTWVDSLTPHLMSITGTFNPATQTMTHTSTGRDSASGEKFERHSTLRYQQDGTRLVESYVTSPDGQTWKMMEVHYTPVTTNRPDEGHLGSHPTVTRSVSEGNHRVSDR